MAVSYEWEVRIYDLAGIEVAQIGGTGTPEGSGQVAPQFAPALNGIDAYTFTMYLDDPQLDPAQGGDPTIIQPLLRIVKLWRHIVDTDVNQDGTNVPWTYDDAPGFPAFCGVITGLEMMGSTQQVTVTAQSPYWRLGSRFHLNNHYLVIDYAGQNVSYHEGGNMDNHQWDVSALAFRLIDLINHAFGPDSRTGIVKPTSGPPYWEKTVTLHGGYRAARGNVVWTEIQELLWAQEGTTATPDLVPTYIHIDHGDSPSTAWKLMIFDTAKHRGEDVSADVSFDFCTGNINLDDLTVSQQATNDNFANYVWAVGQAGPNGARKFASDVSGDYGYDTVGIYMYYSEVSAWAHRLTNPWIQKQANMELARRNHIPETYTIKPSPLVEPYFVTNRSLATDTTKCFELGDVVGIKGDKGMMQVDVKQRIYEVVLQLTENCTEVIETRIAKDFLSKVPLA